MKVPSHKAPVGALCEGSMRIELRSELCAKGVICGSRGLQFMARLNSYKTRRQLVHCRIDVVITRRNVVENPSYLVQNPQTTRALSYICCSYSKKCRSKPVISRHYTVLCRSKSYGTRHNSYYVTKADRRPRTRENLRQ